MPARWLVVLCALWVTAALTVGGCGGRGSLEPGQGQSFKVKGHTYEQVWVAVVRAVTKGFNLDHMDKKAGLVTASLPQVTSGEKVAVYIRPADRPSPVYEVEVACAQRDIYQRDWQERLEHDIRKMLPRSQKQVRP